MDLYLIFHSIKVDAKVLKNDFFLSLQWKLLKMKENSVPIVIELTFWLCFLFSLSMIINS